MRAILSKLRLMGGAGRATNQRVLDAALPGDQKPVARPAIQFEIFRCRDPATGEDEICLLIDQQGFARFEEQAQLRRMTVDEYAYSLMAEKMRRHGLNLSADRFYVTTDLPDLPSWAPPGIKRTLN